MKTPSVPRKVRAGLAHCLLFSGLFASAVLAAPPPPPAHVLAGELTPGGSGTAKLTWAASPGATSYKIYKRNHATDTFTEHPAANVALSGTTAALSGLDDFDSYELAVVAANAAAEESDPAAAAVPYACRRTPLTLTWDDQRYSPGASFDHLNRTVSSTSKVIPYDDEAYRVTIDSAGRLVVNATGTPIPLRFTGVNVVWSAAFPTAAEAPKIAARMAQFGINLVRFHNLDAYAAGETKYPERVGWFESDYATLNAARLDLFDNFVNELAKQGIYSNVNLCVGRRFPDENAPGSYQRFKGLDQMDPDMIARQKALATTLLNHANPYRGNTAYKNDPAVAILEIDNEASLITTWASGGFDPGSSLPLTGVYSSELATRWSDWLRTTRGYGNANNATLQTLWAGSSVGYTQAGTELLTDRDFAHYQTSGYPWKLQVYSTAVATGQVVTETVGGTARQALKISVSTAEAASPEKVKVLYSPISSYLAPSFDYRVPHALHFHARVNTGERVIRVGFRQNGSPYTQLHSVKLKLTSEWQQFDVLLPAVLTSATTVDLFFTDLALQTGDVYLADVSLKEGSPFSSATARSFAEQTTVPGTNPNQVPDQFPASTANEVKVDAWSDPAYPSPNDAADQWAFVNKTDNGDAFFNPSHYLAVTRNSGYEASTSDLYVTRSGLNFTAGATYELSFEARFTPLGGSALTATRISFAAGLSASPYTLYHSGSGDVPMGTWTTQKLVFTAPSGSSSRLLLLLGRLRGTLEFRNFNLVQTAVIAAWPSDSLATGGTVAWPTKTDFRRRTRAFQTDWMNFLWDTESAYFKGMRDYLKGTGTDPDTNTAQLGARQLVIGSQGEYSPNYLQAQDMDIVDVHGYWDHPQSLNGQEYVTNTPMAGQASGGALAPRQAKRILGKPFFCTEYNHPHPNTFGSEGLPELAAFAGYHHWDGIAAFQYEELESSWGLGFENAPYVLGRSTGKMVQFPFIAQALRKALFIPAAESALLVVDRNSVIDTLLDKLSGGIGVGDFTNGTFALNPARSLSMDIATTMNDPLNAGAATPVAYAVQPSAAFVSGNVSVFDSGDQAWDPTTNAQTVQIVAPKAKALIGKLVSGQSYSLADNVTVVPSSTMQSFGTRFWAGYSLILKEGTRFGSAGSRWLVGTMGYTDNLFRKWETDHGPYNSTNKIAYQNGGVAPNFVERIGGTLKFLVVEPNRLIAWDLDENGNRIAPLDVTYWGSGGSRIAIVDLPASPVSAWYEFSVGLSNTPLTMSIAASDGYVNNQTAIGVADAALAANATADTEAPFRNAAWVSTTTAVGVADTDTLRVVSGANAFAGDSGYALSLYDGGTGRGARLDLRGQNIPLDKSWSFEVALRFESGTYDQDELHAVIGQDRDLPVVSVALVRNGSTANYKLRLLTRAGWVDLPDPVANATYVKVEVTVTPAQAGGSNSNGTMTIAVDGVQKLGAETLELPSTTALPEELHLFTGTATTGIARVDAIKITIP